MPKVTGAHSAARRQQIIDAAYRCFARKGFHQTTMREIYDEAGLSPGAVYHYFDGKDAIIRASFEFDRERSTHIFERALADDNPMRALRELASFFFHGLKEASELGAGRVNVQGWGEALVNPGLLASLLPVIESYVDGLAQIVVNAQRIGQVDADLDPRSVARLYLSSYYGFELQVSLSPELDVDEYQAVVERLLFRREAVRTASSDLPSSGSNSEIANQS